VTASDVTEGLRDEGLADADGPEHDDVTVCFEKTQARQLREHSLVEADLGRLVPHLEAHRRIETRFAGTEIGSGVVAPGDLVGEDEQEEIVKRHLLLVGEDESLGQRVGDASELEPFERDDELRVEGGRGGSRHQSPSFFLVVVRVSKCCSGRAKRGGGSGSWAILPSSCAGDAGLVALLSMRVMRTTSTTSKASAL